MDNKVDPAALLIAVVVVGLQPASEPGRWEASNTLVSGLVLAIMLCFLWPAEDAPWRLVIGFALGFGFILGIALAWPWQFLLPRNEQAADVAMACGVATGCVIVACVMLMKYWARVRGAISKLLFRRRPV